MIDLNALPTYELKKRLEAVNRMLESDTCACRPLSKMGRQVLGKELVIIAGILDSRLLVIDAGDPELVDTLDDDSQLNGFEPFTATGKQINDGLDTYEDLGFTVGSFL